MASKPGHQQTSEIIGVLDVGTSKTVCLIVAAPAGARRRIDRAQLLGIGQQPTRGLKAGVVIELDEAEEAIREAVAQAERMSGITLERVFVAVACGRLKSATLTAERGIEDGLVSATDIDQLTDAGRNYAELHGRTLLHLNHLSYRLDGVAGARNPCGMAARVLSADMHVVTADDPPLNNLLHTIERAYISAAGLAPAPLASGLAATTEEERRLGVLCADIGAGTTTLSVFAEGQLLAVDAVLVGGNHATMDIARALSVPLSEAERIKKEYGTLEPGGADDTEVISYTRAGEEDDPLLLQVTRGHIREIVRSRMSSLFGHVAERVERLGVARYATQRAVLTGGASDLAGMSRLGAEILGRPARQSGPPHLNGLPPELCSPALSTAVGLVHVALDASAGVRAGIRDLAAIPGGYLQRVGQWLKESF
jgi:cell division protein FtsA